MKEFLEKNNNTTLGYIQTCCGYWVTTAPKGWRYSFKKKAWVFNGK